LAQPDRQRGLRWALGREYRVTYTDSLRDSETVIAGRWWKGDGPLRDGQPVPVSLEREIAASLRVGVGDEIRWSVQGVPIDSVVQSVREVDWGRMGTNFFALFPPGVLEEAPQSSVVLARLDGDQARAELQRDLVTRFPNVSVLDATMILRSLDALMSKTSLAVRVVALFVVATGFGILIAAAAAARHERTREALLLRTLGASAQTVRRVIVSEAVALGALAALVGAGLAVLAGWGLVHYMFELSFSPPWFDLAALSLATVAVTALVGAGSGGSVARKPPLAGLRAAELGT
jgi:putative ABC transport system permease protein